MKSQNATIIPPLYRLSCTGLVAVSSISEGFGLIAGVSARIVKEGVLCHHGYVPIHP
jgi:hypothetical protein